MSEVSDKPVVLVVDDMPDNRMVLDALLVPDYRVLEAASGAQALAAARAEPAPDLILLDVMMPEMDGYAVLERLQADPAARGIPVIFVTALDDDADEERGFALGAVDYIHKPVRATVALARIRTQIELKRGRDLLARRNENLELEISRRIAENQLIQDVSMRVLASLAETRDNETGNHIRRTQHYVELLARELADHPRFPALGVASVTELIVKAAPLHDIGKVGIPDQILLKPGKLTDAERMIMQTHTRLGAEAIEVALRGEDNQAPLAFLHIAMDIAYSHHEKWDGSGYPDRLSGEAIPVAARLMAVADVFDALISRRVYKPPLPFDQAAAIIRAGRGTHFDPAIVDAFEAQFDGVQAIARRYADE